MIEVKGLDLSSSVAGLPADRRYDPSIFTRVNNLQAAKNIILTDEATLTTNERWERETPHVCDLIEKSTEIDSKSVVLDYGCGVGRLAKELIRRRGCFVIGADIAPNMQALAASYVSSDRFMTCHPSALGLISVKVDVVLAVWVLQHVADLVGELTMIGRALKHRGNLFVVNEGSSRFVPTTRGWVNDRLDVRAELTRWFAPLDSGKLDPEVVGKEQSDRTFWGSYVRDG